MRLCENWCENEPQIASSRRSGARRRGWFWAARLARARRNRLRPNREFLLASNSALNFVSALPKCYESNKIAWRDDGDVLKGIQRQRSASPMTSCVAEPDIANSRVRISQ